MRDHNLLLLCITFRSARVCEHGADVACRAFDSVRAAAAGAAEHVSPQRRIARAAMEVHGMVVCVCVDLIER